MRVKMIVTDLDSTLLRSDKTVSSYTASIFHQCSQAGIKIVFATARPKSMVTEYSKIIPINGLIATNGAFVYVEDRLIKEYVIPADISRAMLLELGTNPKILRISARKSNAYYTTKPRSNEDIVYNFAKPLDEVVSHFSFTTDDNVFADEIIKKYPQVEAFCVSGENLYDINPAGCTKASGVKFLSKHFNVALSQTAAFGDDYNDVELLQTCGVGVAVENAIDKVKAVANFICNGNDSDGVAKWIESNILK